MENANKPINGKIQSTTNNQNQLFEVFTDEYNVGLTKREYFAGLAMQGLAENSAWARSMRTPDDWDEHIYRIASGAVEIADKLLKELEK